MDRESRAAEDEDASHAAGAPRLSFPERVYRVVRQIPRGKVTTYGTIAAMLGERRGARMVGWAMSGCPDDVSDVAHRVVNRYGELSGGWAWGHPDVMKALLEDEGVGFVDEYRVDLKAHLWTPPIEPERSGGSEIGVLYSDEAEEADP